LRADDIAGPRNREGGGISVSPIHQEQAGDDSVRRRLREGADVVGEGQFVVVTKE
jgi:hypothetical protein